MGVILSYFPSTLCLLIKSWITTRATAAERKNSGRRRRQIHLVRRSESLSLLSSSLIPSLTFRRGWGHIYASLDEKRVEKLREGKERRSKKTHKLNESLIPVPDNYLSGLHCLSKRGSTLNDNDLSLISKDMGCDCRKERRGTTTKTTTE